MKEKVEQAKVPPFLPKKYLPWVLKREKQPIEYYLLQVNEVEAD